MCTACASKEKIIHMTCKFCGCKNHINIDLEESMCELLGFCNRCDKFKYDDFVNPKEDFLLNT